MIISNVTMVQGVVPSSVSSSVCCTRPVLTWLGRLARFRNILSRHGEYRVPVHLSTLQNVVCTHQPHLRTRRTVKHHGGQAWATYRSA